jgi:hypothetical protein
MSVVSATFRSNAVVIATEAEFVHAVAQAVEPSAR